jgi:hypothetical protein
MIDTKKHAVLKKAINTRKLISFQYHGKDRLAEPHDYGRYQGARRLLSYQVGGESTSGGLPNWRLVEVEDIGSLKITPKTFRGNRPTPSGQHYKWDAIFASVSLPVTDD